MDLAFNCYSENCVEMKVVLSYDGHTTPYKSRRFRIFVGQLKTIIVFSPSFICRIWGSHSDGCEKACLLEYNAVLSVKSQPTFRLNMIPASRWFLFSIIFRPWRWRRHFPPKRRLTFTRIYGVITQKTGTLFHSLVQCKINISFLQGTTYIFPALIGALVA
jgi:hypothetical protein